MIAKLYVSYVADFLAVALMIWQLFRMRKLPAQKEPLKQYFQRLSLVVLIMSVLHLLGSYAALQMGGMSAEDYGKLYDPNEPWVWVVSAAYIIDIFLTTVFLYMWISFLSWSLFEDKDFIRRKFWLGFTPLIISAVVTGVAIPMAVLSEQGFVFYIVAVVVFFIIRILYFLFGLWLLREYKRQNGYLRFFNPWVFFIPVFAGFILQDVFELGFSALGATLGIVLIYNSIMAEQNYMDPRTDFYSMKFVGYLKKLIDKKRYDPCSAMIFTLNSPGEMQEFSELLKKQLPKNCEPILRGDREIVVLTSVDERGPLAMVIEDVKAVSEVGTGCSLRKKTETAVEFMERVL